MRKNKYRVWDKDEKRMYEDVGLIGTMVILEHEQSGYDFCEIDLNLYDHLDSNYALMQYTGIEDNNKKELFEADTLVLDIRTISEDNLFWGSNLGEMVRKHDVDEVVVQLGISEYLGLDYTVYLKRNDRFLTEHDIYENDDEELFTETDNSSLFINYLIKKGANIVGNMYEKPLF